MSLLKKLFGAKSSKAAPPKSGSAKVKARKPGTIQGYDKYGRQITITRDDWLNSVLLGNIEKAWNDPEQLAQMIVGGLQDEFYHEIEDAAAHLCTIDPIPARAAVYYAIIFLQTDRPAKAKAVLTEHIGKHGEEGTVLTNLAKAQSALGREAEALQTLWHALELDPNQDNGLGWYEVIHRDKDEDAAGRAALRRVAELPGSWRAQLWLARAALEAGDLDSALAQYDHSLRVVGDAVPSDLLQQMSGDLGNAGHLVEIINRVTPHYAPARHGIQVANNLIKANIDTGQLPAAKAILRQLQLQQRPDWQESIGYWETELSKAACATQNVPGQKMPSVSLLWLDGPITLKPEAPTTGLFPAKAPDAPRICFLGSTAETANMGKEVQHQGSNNEGRFSRALPLYLAEQTYHTSTARVCTLIPWVAGEHASFVLSGVMWKDDDAASHARNGQTPNDYVVISHLQARGENWTLLLRYVRTIDAKCLRSHSYQLAEFTPHFIATQLNADLQAFLREEAGAEPIDRPHLQPPGGTELNHYLFRIEQSLAVRCYAMEGSNALGLSNPAEIIGGMIHCCVQNPDNLSCRLLLLRTLAALKKIDAELTRSFQENVEALMTEHPLSESATDAIQQELREVFAG